MSNAFYALVEERWLLNGTERISYGIAVYDEEPDGSAVPTAAYHDITPDRQRLLALIRQCNLLRLSPLHLQDAINDFLETD